MALFAFILCSGSHTPSSGSSIDGDLDKTISDLTAQITKIKYQLTNFTKRRTRANQRVKLSFHKDIKQLSKTREELLTKINALQVNKRKTSKPALIKDLKGIIATFVWYKKEAQQKLKGTSLEYLSEMTGFVNNGVEVSNASDAILNGFYHRETMTEDPPQEYIDRAVAAGHTVHNVRTDWLGLMRGAGGRPYYWKPAGQSGVPCIILWQAAAPSAAWPGWGCMNLPVNDEVHSWYTGTAPDNGLFSSSDSEPVPPAGEWVEPQGPYYEPSGKTLTLNVIE